jgi:hypothetical protein
MKPDSNIKIVNLLIFVAFLLSCKPVSKITVNNVSDAGSSQAGSFIYALPQTVVDVQVMAEEVAIVPGPYYKFANKYLGIENVPEKAESIWHIREMQLFNHVEADPDYIYTVNGIEGPEANTGIQKLLSHGLILSAKDFSFMQASHYGYPASQDRVVYSDLSVKRNFEAEKDIDVSLVMPDTDEASRPAGRTALKEKTIEQKAEEAANFLIKLKKRRFKLVAGQYDYMPQGEAMADALQELARLEEMYLSLFIGKRIINTHQRNYSFTPVTGKETDRVVLFRFSESTGFADVRDAEGVPVVLELHDDNKTKVLEQYRLPVKQTVNLLHYRVADQVSIKLLAGEQVWGEAKYPVFQAGAIVPMLVGK